MPSELTPEEPSQPTTEPPVSLGNLSLSLDVPPDVEQMLRNTPDVEAWLCQVITTAARRDLRQYGTSQSLHLAIQSTTDDRAMAATPNAPRRPVWPEVPTPYPIGTLVRSPSRRLGRVINYDSDSGRYRVAYNQGGTEEFPEHLLTFVEAAN